MHSPVKAVGHVAVMIFMEMGEQHGGVFPRNLKARNRFIQRSRARKQRVTRIDEQEALSRFGDTEQVYALAEHEFLNIENAMVHTMKALAVYRYFIKELNGIERNIGIKPVRIFRHCPLLSCIAFCQ